MPKKVKGIGRKKENTQEEKFQEKLQHWKKTLKKEIVDRESEGEATRDRQIDR